MQTSYLRLSLNHVAEGGTTAEEVISTVRTAQAFGVQNILATLYETYIGKAHVYDLKAAAWRGGIYGIFFFIIYGGYGLGTFFSLTLSHLILMVISFLIRYHSH